MSGALRPASLRSCAGHHRRHAAPAYAGIPVTHRDFNSSFTSSPATKRKRNTRIRRADTDQAGAAAGSDVDWAALAKLPCLAFYMGVKALPRICAKLIDHGMRSDTPAATIRWGTTRGSEPWSAPWPICRPESPTPAWHRRR